MTERKLSCNAAACLKMASGAFLSTPELDVDFSWILKDFFSSSRVSVWLTAPGKRVFLPAV